MTKKFPWLKKLLPILSAIAVFLVIDMIYFAPQFKGEEIKMHDVTQWQGMGKDIKDYRAEHGIHPNWAGRMFSGMPAYYISNKQPAVFIPKVRKAVEWIGYPTSLVFVAMLSFLLMLLIWGVNPWIAIPSSLGYGLSSYMFIIIGAGHVTKMAALAYAPLMVGAVYFAFRKNKWVGSALTALVGTVEIATGHPQITYYFAMAIVAFVINEGVIAYKAHKFADFTKTCFVVAAAGLLALGANLSGLYYTAIAAKDTVRGGSELKTNEKGKITNKGLDLDYATAWSYGKAESFNMLIPNLTGGQSSGGFEKDGEVAKSLSKYNARGLATQLPGYWGPQPMTSGPVYIGAVIIFLAIFGFFLLSGVHKWWVLIISGITLMLAWGNNFMWFTELFFKILPGYNKFRTVSMILVVLQWSFPLIAALALNKLLCKDLNRIKALDALKKSFGITAGLCLLFFLFGSSLFSFSSSSDASMGLPEDVIAAMKTERLAMLKSDAMRSLLFVIATAALVFMRISKALKLPILVGLISLLVTIDLVGVNLRYLPQSRFMPKADTEIKPTAADLQILKDKELGYRVANLSLSTFNDATTSYFHRSVGGYHGAKLSRYQDLIERHLSKMNMQVYNMLNTKYFITSSKDNPTPTPQLNGDANGTAWFVDSLIVSNTPEEEISALNKIDTKKTAVVDKSFNVSSVNGTSSGGTISLVEYAPHHLVYDYKSSSPKTAVFSEVYYPKGWTAYIDGEPADYFRVNYILRAMNLPSGEHKIEFKFKAENYDTIAMITYICSAIILLGLLIISLIYIKKTYVSTKQ